MGLRGHVATFLNLASHPSSASNSSTLPRVCSRVPARNTSSTITQGSTRRLSTSPRRGCSPRRRRISSQRERKSRYFRSFRALFVSIGSKRDASSSNVRKHVQRVARLPQHPVQWLLPFKLARVTFDSSLNVSFFSFFFT